jgi:hypothetical protein
MARKLKNPGFVTQAAFARKLGVTAPAVSQAIQSGRLVAYNGRGERVQPGYGGRKWLKPAEAMEDWDNNRLRVDDFALQAADGLQESFWEALGAALEGIVGWTGEKRKKVPRLGGRAARKLFLWFWWPNLWSWPGPSRD